jgi:8-hydroxy-5-deazaflavin:NADPH oxidoreductase
VRVGFVGAGMIGQALATRFGALGHEAMLSNSRGPETLERVVASIPGEVQAGTVAEAARFGELGVVAIPLRAIAELPADAFAGKTVVDANNYYPDRDGRIPELDRGELTSSGLLASVLPDASVVKAFNTIFFRRLLEDGRPDLPAAERLAIPVAADDADAKRQVLDLIEQIGFAGVDAGSLAESGAFEPGTPVYAAFAEARHRRTLLTPARLRELLGSS